MNSEGTTKMCNIVKECTELNVLKLNWNKFESEGSERILKEVSIHNNLEYIDLSKNKIEFLSKSINFELNKALKRVNFICNLLDDNSCDTLFSWFLKNNQIEIIKLTNNNISEKSIFKNIENILKIKSLKQVTIKGLKVNWDLILQTYNVKMEEIKKIIDV